MGMKTSMWKAYAHAEEPMRMRMFMGTSSCRFALATAAANRLARAIWAAEIKYSMMITNAYSVGGGVNKQQAKKEGCVIQCSVA